MIGGSALAARLVDVALTAVVREVGGDGGVGGGHGEALVADGGVAAAAVHHDAAELLAFGGGGGEAHFAACGDLAAAGHCAAVHGGGEGVAALGAGATGAGAGAAAAAGAAALGTVASDGEEGADGGRAEGGVREAGRALPRVRDLPQRGAGAAAGGEPLESGAVLQRRPGENRPAIPAEPQEGRQGGRAHAGAGRGNRCIRRRRTQAPAHRTNHRRQKAWGPRRCASRPPAFLFHRFHPKAPCCRSCIFL